MADQPDAPHPGDSGAEATAPAEPSPTPSNEASEARPDAGDDRPSASPDAGDSPAQAAAPERSDPEQPAVAEHAAAQAEAEPGTGEASADASTAPGAVAESALDASGAPAEAASAGDAEASADAAAGDKPKRKRKRRRKKKGEVTAAGEPSPGETERPKKKEGGQAPLARFFAGANAAKRHAFAVGEVVAGRVQLQQDGVIAVDLFGKATAYADEHEPREIPPEPVPEPKAPAEAAAEPSGEAAADEASEAAPPEGIGAQTGEGTTDAAAAEMASDGSEPEAAVDPVAADESAAPQAPTADAAQEAGVAAEAASPESAAESDAEAAPQPPAEPADAEPSVAASDAADAASEPVADDAPAEAAAEENASATETEAPEGVAATDEAPEARAPRGKPQPPAPVVPDTMPRQEPVRQGAIFRGRVGLVAESGHIAILNRNVDVKAVRARLDTYREERRRVEGLVFGFNRGGFDVLVEGVRAFCPASAMSLEEITDPHALVGKKLEFLLPLGQSSGKDVVVTRRSILEREQRRRAKELLKSIEPGAKLKGRVTQIREFGLFVDIGGIEGLVHQSELSYGHGTRPDQVAAVGDEVEVQVLRVGADPKKGEPAKKERTTRISLSLKALEPDPWDAHRDVLREGAVREGKVTRTAEFGAFIELAPQIEGLLHVSELGREVQSASHVLKAGEQLHVVVERVDRKARRISLSKLSEAELAEYQEKGEAAEPPPRVKPGARLTVVVDRVDHRGLVVRVGGVYGRKARGFIPNSEMATERGTDHRKGFPPGTEIEVKVIGIDRDGGLKCSRKALQLDDERKAIKDYRREASKQGFGTFGDLLKAKLGDAAPK